MGIPMRGWFLRVEIKSKRKQQCQGSQGQRMKGREIQIVAACDYMSVKSVASVWKGASSGAEEKCPLAQGHRSEWRSSEVNN